MSTENLDQEKDQALSSDDQAFLNRLDQVDKTLATDQGEPAQASIGGLPAEIEDPVEENADMLRMLIAMATPMLPFLPECYPEKTIKQIAVAYTEVEKKYGWNFRSGFPPELALAIVAVPPTVQAVMLGRLYFEQKKAEANQGGQSGGAADGNS